ncbi:MAG: outer membrane protein assembly factor BamD [Deltaproteobacteria bacterium]|nr:MAG: outer membrane protein assembly factor BamD [Deltaproteobacteria bacterium]
MGIFKNNKTVRFCYLGLLCLLGGALFFGGCASMEWLFGKEEEKPPSELMDQAMDDLARGYYKSATEAFQKIKDRYPYSKFAIVAEMKMADTLYMQSSYDEAYDAYKEFEKLHPKNPSIPYVIYREGMCNYKQMKSIDRDQTHSMMAKEDFGRLVKRFPKSVYAARARMKIRKCFMDLAQHELYVGRFYFKKKKYRAAAGRFQYALEHYPDVGQYYEALEYLGRCEEKLAKK